MPRVFLSVSSATFCFLAGVSAFDEKAAAATPPLPPVDSINMWGLISGANKTSPRREWALTPFGQLLYATLCMFMHDSKHQCVGTCLT